MCQPEGYNNGTGHVARLLCSIYGLKQAAHVWNKLMHQKLITVGYDQLTSDTAVYLCNHNDDITILTIYIDNVMSFGNTKPGLSKSQAELHKLFEMKEEDPNWVMGFKLIENRKEATVSIDHSLYVNAVLRWFGMDDCNTTCTPLDSGNILSVHDCLQTDEERSEMCTVPYWELVSALMWIAVVSRPDISFVAMYLTCFNANPRQTHWKATKHILCYLKGTANYQLTMGLHLNNPSELITYADLDWGCDMDTRRSVSGYIFLLGKSAVSWSARGKQFKSTEHIGVGWVGPETFLTNFVKTCMKVNDMGSNWSVGIYRVIYMSLQQCAKL